MEENAELWSYPDDKSINRTLMCWFKDRNIPIDSKLSNTELQNLYIAIECGKDLEDLL